MAKKPKHKTETFCNKSYRNIVTNSIKTLKNGPHQRKKRTSSALNGRWSAKRTLALVREGWFGALAGSEVPTIPAEEVRRGMGNEDIVQDSDSAQMSRVPVNQCWAWSSEPGQHPGGGLLGSPGRTPAVPALTCRRPPLRPIQKPCLVLGETRPWGRFVRGRSLFQDLISFFCFFFFIEV